MEYDPKTNTYTSHGPKAQAEENERELKSLRKENAMLRERIRDLEAELNEYKS
ncbi:hypothetical protein AB0N65_11910 [Paenarthrobacter sp. NPDC089322]|uniref:hypothetical protein n=1 Tax=Paenarthrobacter sp. NPDC089322 TaxID=3155065 RepID=UPI00344A51CF